MEEYQKLFSVQRGQTLAGCPVVLAAGNLLKHTETNTLLAQLRFVSISVNPVVSMTIELECFDESGAALGKIEHTYTDLNAAQNDSFGEQEAIVLPYLSARSFSVRLQQLIFEDQIVWENMAQYHSYSDFDNFDNEDSIACSEQFNAGTETKEDTVPEMKGATRTGKTSARIAAIATSVILTCVALLMVAIIPKYKGESIVSKPKASTETIDNSGDKLSGGNAKTEPNVEEPTEPDKGNNTSTESYNLAVGGIITFGSFEQDNVTTNGKEPIEWVVLAKEGNSVLVISKYALEGMAYFRGLGEDRLVINATKWASSSVNSWLNRSFINEAFTPDEQSRILSIAHPVDRPYYFDNSNEERETSEKIFLLSLSEIERYSQSVESWECQPTAYATNKGSLKSRWCSSEPKYSNNCSWWLRTQGYRFNSYDYECDPDGLEYMMNQGTIDETGFPTIMWEYTGTVYPGESISAVLGVRPAMWINLGKIETASAQSKQSQSEPTATEKPEATTKSSIATAFNNAQVGSTITFGMYEQDNNTANGKEPIEWRVLAKEGKKMLVISRFALDCQKFNSSNTNIAWEFCSLRAWLNESFFKNALTSTEQSWVLSSSVVTDSYSTMDRVFLLSAEEATRFFNSDDARKCLPTDYALARGVWTNNSFTVDGKATCWWWLRSPGSKEGTYAVDVLSNGSIYYAGYDGNRYGDGAVRPAMWISLG